MLRTLFVLVGFFLGMSCPLGALAVQSGKTLTWPGGGQGVVEFEGKEHAKKGYKCDACHPKLFQMKKGGAKMTMVSLNSGQYCGVCHNGRTAFSTDDSRKCHECHKGHKKEKKKHHDDDHEKHHGDDD